MEPLHELAVSCALVCAVACNVGVDEEQAWNLGERRRVFPDARVAREVEVEQREFAVQVPLGLELRAIAVVGRDGVSVGERAAVHGVVSSLGALELGERARTGSLYAYGGQAPLISARAVVGGYVKTRAEALLSDNARVSAGVVPGVPGWVEVFDWDVAAPPNDGQTCIASGDEPSLALVPGSYAGIQASTGAVVVLRSGTYHFQSLRLGAGSRLEVDNLYGPVYVWVTERLELGGTLALDFPDGNVLLGYAGTDSVVIHDLQATLVAPAASVTLRAGETANGAIFAREVIIEPKALLVQRSFEILPADLMAIVTCRRCAERQRGARVGGWMRVDNECFGCPSIVEPPPRAYRSRCGP